MSAQPEAEIPDLYRGALAYRRLDDGRCLVVYRMLPGQLRLTIGEDGAMTYDDYWCFHGAHALVACEGWDGEGDPPGPWYRNGSTARRRRFDDQGELVEEWIAT